MLAFLAAASAFAHDPGLSSMNVDLGPREIAVLLTFNERDIASVASIAPETLHDPIGGELPAEVRALAARAVVLECNGEALSAAPPIADHDANNNVEFRYIFPRPLGGELNLRSLLLKDLPFGHRQAFTLRDASGRERSRALLSSRDDSAHFSLDAGATPMASGHSFVDFLSLGIRHILTGYDHLLFLFGLLVMCRRGRTAALLITCFTAAHSLTLALSTFGLVQLHSRFVEAAIAASILYVGVENLVRREGQIRGRAAVTFAFGLVHGLGFASVLREMGVANSGIAAVIPLVAFNSGVELGQLSVAALILPLIWFLRRRDQFVRFGVPVCSLAVALAGGYWLVERTLR